MIGAPGKPVGIDAEEFRQQQCRIARRIAIHQRLPDPPFQRQHLVKARGGGLARQVHKTDHNLRRPDLASLRRVLCHAPHPIAPAKTPC